MFAALLNTDRTPHDPRRLETAAAHVEMLGEAGHVAFLWSRNGSPADAEMGGVHSLDGRCWIVGRLRLDRRAELLSRLSHRLGRSQGPVCDSVLCLHAYAQWGDQFLDHLAGDFCFALWDGERARLIAARDQFGVRSLFHATAGATLVVSDSLDWLAARPEADRTLDDTWIADFLGLGLSLDPDRTVWRHVHRLPPAHVLTASGQGVQIRRYWRLTLGEPIHYRDRRQYGERFRELTAQAIADRMPAGRVGISMSGGLDSTTLAAVTVEATGDASRVVADCVHFESLMPDEERTFATLAAQRLGIALATTAIDELVYDPDWRTRSIRTAEPMASIVHAHPDRLLNRAMAAQAPVWFFGEGPDNALKFERKAYLSWLVVHRRWGRLAQALWLYMGAKGMGDWRSTFRRYAAPGTAIDDASLPAWLSPDLAARTQLEDRRLRLEDGMGEAPHPWHPQAMASLESPAWQRQFASFDADEVQAPFVWRHPFVDLRVVNFMLSVPPVPWARRKLLLREAMRDRLPEQVRTRDKTPLARYPLAESVRRRGLPALSSGDRLAAWVDVRRLPVGPLSDADLDPVVAVHALDYWLTQQRSRP